MQKQTPKIIVIMGPTASGKSGVAIKLARKFNGEIISADSRQVYRGMDVGTGKVDEDSISRKSKVESFASSLSSGRKQNAIFISEGIIHHLIDVAEPMEDFNISHFKTLAEKAIKEILTKGKIPIICGGTAFWIDAIVKNINIPEVAPNIELRGILEERSLEELFLQLQKLDPERAKNIDNKNKVRLIRALEICAAIGKVPTLSSVISHQSSRYKFLEIGVKAERAQLNEKIQKRLDERFNENMVAEVQKLNENGVTWEWMERIGLEYRWIARFLQNQIGEKEMREKLYFDIIHYAKRQMTWLKKNKSVIWLNDYLEIEKKVIQFLKK